MDLDGWLQTGLVLLIAIGTYLLIRRPLQRKKLFDLAAGKLKHRQHEHSAKKLSHRRRR
jgi:hypothetical protein